MGWGRGGEGWGIAFAAVGGFTNRVSNLFIVDAMIPTPMVLSPSGGFPLTKIIATLGPASADVPTVVRLIEEGARVFRINFSHGHQEDFARFLALVREASQATGIEAAVLGDLAGPKIRVGQTPPEGIETQPGDSVAFTGRGRDAAVIVGAEPGLLAEFPTSHAQIVNDVAIGHRLLVDDGAVRMLVVDRQIAPSDGSPPRLICQVIVGGRITSGKGVNLPDSMLSISSMTPRDEDCARWAVENQLDFLALSFVRQAEDVRGLKRLLRSITGNAAQMPPVIAKIETPQALADLEGILGVTDAVMVARGDLGVEMDLAEVPALQKRILRQAHEFGRPVIVATQMLQSMIVDFNPTRAEVSDVANAIFDGADAVMLSGETAVGNHPIQAVHMMARIARTTEKEMAGDPAYKARAPMRLRESRYRTAALAHGVSAMVSDLSAKLVVNWAELGGGAKYLSQNRMDVPILGFSESRVAMRQMNLMFGVMAVAMERPADGEEFIAKADAVIQSRGWAKVGDPIVIVKGEPLGMPGVTNHIVIHYVGDVVRLRWRAKPGL